MIENTDAAPPGVSGEDNGGRLPSRPATSRMPTQATLLSLSTAGNAAALRVRQSTKAHTRRAMSA